MPINRQSDRRMRVTEVEEFLRKPPPGFSVETLGWGYRVRCNEEEESLVLIDDFESCGKKIVFQNSLGRKVKMHNLWDYSSMRTGLLSKKFYLLASACENKISVSNRKAAREIRALKQFVVCIDGSDPFIKWQLERGMDGTISSVAGESYRVDIDLTEEMEIWAATNLLSDNLMKVRPVWRDASFTLKYYSDALFDFPHWLGFSRRKFKLRMT